MFLELIPCKKAAIGFVPIISIAMILGLACGGAQMERDARIAERITDQNANAQARELLRLQPGSKARRNLRNRLITYHGNRWREVSPSYEQARAQLELLTSFLHPNDFDKCAFPKAFIGPSKAMIQFGEKRGDEAGVLAAYMLLACSERTQAGKHNDEYSALRAWGFRARKAIDDPMARYSQLIGVWSRHLELAPAPAALTQLAELHTARVDLDTRGSASELARLLLQGKESLTRRLALFTPFEVASIYLRYGDVSGALERVKGIRRRHEMKARLEQVLADAAGDGEQGAEAKSQLADLFIKEAEEPAVARGICARGLRDHPSNYVFPLCLARVYQQLGKAPEDATAWYAEAVALAPKKKEVFDESLAVMGRFISSSTSDDPSEVRRIASHAEKIIEQYHKSFPNDEPQVKPAVLQYLMGSAELNAGFPDRARQRYLASAELEPSASAYLQLGLLALRLGHYADARKAFDTARELKPPSTLGAAIEEYTGDTKRYEGDGAAAKVHYQKALRAWKEASMSAEQLDDKVLPVSAALRSGVLYSRLGDEVRSREAFEVAMKQAPRDRAVYATVLSHLVVSDDLDLDFAVTTYLSSMSQLTLEKDWRVYCGLWVAIIARRLQKEIPQDVRIVMEDMARESTWYGKLAKFGAGQKDAVWLMGQAITPGHKAEAAFYAATLGPYKGALTGPPLVSLPLDFAAVFQTHMLSFYEYQMARELNYLQVISADRQRQ